MDSYKTTTATKKILEKQEIKYQKNGSHGNCLSSQQFVDIIHVENTVWYVLTLVKYFIVTRFLYTFEHHN